MILLSREQAPRKMYPEGSPDAVVLTVREVVGWGSHEGKKVPVYGGTEIYYRRDNGYELQE